ncbi:hypothetical protein MHYP_G00252670 [Metynnis hypsauchen]
MSREKEGIQEEVEMEALEDWERSVQQWCVSFTWIRLKQESVDARAERRERVLIGLKIEALTGGAEGARVMMMMMTDGS